MDLKSWNEKIKEKRKNTDFKKFLREVASWRPIVLNKNNGLISRYGIFDRVQNCDNNTFSKNRDDLVNFGIDYDFNCDFPKNFQKNFSTTDLPNLLKFLENENCDFADEVMGAKNVYLSSAVVNSQNVLYSLGVRNNCKDILGSAIVWDNCENIYISGGIIQSFNVFYSRYILNSSNIWFCSDLDGCSECIFCDNIKNKSYCINNEQYEKEDYLTKKKEILSDKINFSDFHSQLPNSTNNFIINSENIRNSIYVYNTKNGNNLVLAGGTKESSDLFDIFSCSGGSQDCFGVMGLGGSNNVYNSCNIGLSSNIYYSYFLESCSFCIGCVGLKNKSYCILNKQYTETQRYEIADKVFVQMEEQGILGDFLPGYINPFYFNDTLAYLIDDSFEKENLVRDGFLWRDSEIRVDIPSGTGILETKNLDLINFDESILKKAIKDKNGNFYRIVKIEYDFLKRHNLPLPDLHWLERIKIHFK